ncbi:4-amino-4-deoxychorismate lyase [Pseudomonas oryzihabitans]|uniref:Aminodeoxychorismate lyase n=1 Tax=Pseudomonas oryzihabitans TaxID=47885 RepID=A0A0U4HIG5_9PSED|nr:4-amino-4-deoxychorismate lyase [Pseudomonas oryzihabitans]
MIQDWLNGQPLTPGLQRDRGLAYGDGLFETIAVRRGQPRLLERHLQRLATGCQRLRIPCDLAQVGAEIQAYAALLGEGVAKLLLTRGDGLRGYAPPAEPEVRRLLLASPAPAYPAAHAAEGIALFPCTTRLASQPLLAGLKHLNRLEQVLARGEWTTTEYAEGLMLDQDGRPIEGVFSNLFLVREGRLLTPALDHCGVAGVMRGLLMDLAAQEGMQTAVMPLSLDALFQADEVFLCNSQYGIWPVRRYAAANWSVGPVTRKLQGSINEILE